MPVLCPENVVRWQNNFRPSGSQWEFRLMTAPVIEFRMIEFQSS